MPWLTKKASYNSSPNKNMSFFVSLPSTDCAKEGMTPHQLQDSMQRLNTYLSLEQEKNRYHQTFKKDHIGKIKPREFKTQATSSQRSQYTAAQQFRWRKKIENVLEILRTKNTVVCRRIGNSFGELIEHFIIGRGKTCLISEADGTMKIIEEFGSKKHEEKVYD